jgi:predicted RNA-binding protein with TRAM domain
MYQDRYGGRSSGGFNDRQQAPPVKEGEEIDVTIEAVGEKGDGIAKQKGFVLFVPGTKAGERVRIRITKVLAKVGFAQSIGPALTQAGEEPKRVVKKEPEFDANEEMDSEDFGDETSEEPEKEE